MTMAGLGGTLAAAAVAVAVALGAGATRAEEGRGPVTNLPLPRFVSLKTDEGNARRGPGLTHVVDWVFTRRDMPLRVTAEFEHWRRVEDRDGAGGWVHYALLSGERTVIVEGDGAVLRGAPGEGSPAVARAEAGVVAWLLACAGAWCRIGAEGLRGWVPRAALWGVGEDETIP